MTHAYDTVSFRSLKMERNESGNVVLTHTVVPARIRPHVH